jgi:hypothetical protein
LQHIAIWRQTLKAIIEIATRLLRSYKLYGQRLANAPEAGRSQLRMTKAYAMARVTPTACRAPPNLVVGRKGLRFQKLA